MLARGSEAFVESHKNCTASQVRTLLSLETSDVADVVERFAARGGQGRKFSCLKSAGKPERGFADNGLNTYARQQQSMFGHY